MKAGSLVHITRAGIGVPVGTIGLIMKVYGSDRFGRYTIIEVINESR